MNKCELDVASSVYAKRKRYWTGSSDDPGPQSPDGRHWSNRYQEEDFFTMLESGQNACLHGAIEDYRAGRKIRVLEH
jgi:hypothetical protein